MSISHNHVTDSLQTDGRAMLLIVEDNETLLLYIDLIDAERQMPRDGNARTIRHVCLSELVCVADQLYRALNRRPGRISHFLPKLANVTLRPCRNREHK